ncbi:MOSC domain-containing protein [Rhizobium sp. Rhizsp42]|uniref:MOSC domain-containing protein n=1 Tax=Rhizobium sp. Rhizsp42 TaxID=3243034 RepID=UPI0039AF82A5
MGSDPIEVAATVQALWRYPVSSLRGERLKTHTVTADGIRGDRSHLLVDLVSGEIAAPEKIARWRPALMIDARTDDGGLLISSVDWNFFVDDPKLDNALSDHFGFRCAIRGVGSTLPTDEGEVTLSPRYVASPLHLLSTRSLSDLSGLIPQAVLDVRRFRPNIVMDTSADENNWIGSQIAIGDYRGTVTEKTKRCGMTMIAQTDLPEDPEVLRTVVRSRQRCFGVYADVGAEGVISIGDKIEVG